MARRPFTDAENEIIGAGARAGLACTVIVDRLRQAGSYRSETTVSKSPAFRAGRAELDSAGKRAKVVRRDAKSRAAALKASELSTPPSNPIDQFIFEAARKGTTLDAIASALLDAELGDMETSAIARCAAYRDGRELAPKPRRGRPWTQEEREIVVEGARRGLAGVALSQALAAKGYQRTPGSIVASNHYFAGKRLGQEDATQAEVPSPVEPVSGDTAVRERGFVRRWNGVSLVNLEIQKDWGEVVAR